LAADPTSRTEGSGGGLKGATPRDIFLFAARTLGWAAVFFTAWYLAARPISLGVSWIAARMLEATPAVGKAHIAWRDARVAFEMTPDASIAYRYRLRNDMLLEEDVNTLKQLYGVPFFLALLAAARTRKFAAKAAIGVAILTLLAAIGISCEMVIGLGGIRTPLGEAPFVPGAFAGTLYALGFQLGTLIFPAVVPVAMAVAMNAEGIPGISNVKSDPAPRPDPPLDC
jgi:hypothetical protein